DMIAFHCKEYDEELRERLKRLCTRGGTSTEEMCIMNAYLGEMLAQAACEAASKAGISMEGADFISSHGQTIWHQPIVDKTDRCAVPSTLQIGDISIIAKHTGVPVIGDY
ncbi:anhydro-N-acetylmuramic acid kinase, partial [Enterobacter quasiroggenkampii]|nr:anhydro-N-acetylmuramic acid kinase [Enterobacter quasiroggenkampii]